MGNFKSVTTLARVDNPVGIERYSSGYLITHGNKISFMDGTTFALTTIAGQSSGGKIDADGTNAQFNSPHFFSVHLTNSASALIADTNNHCIRMLSLSPPYTVTTVAGHALGFDDGDGTNALFNYPHDVKFVSASYVVIADYANHLIRIMISSAPYTVTTIAGHTSGGYENGVGTNAKFYFPRSALVHTSDSFYVVDGNNGIRLVTISSGDVGSFCGFNGEGTTDGDCGAVAQFSNPGGMCSVALAPGTQYVVDTNTHRIRKIANYGSEVITTTGSVEGYVDGPLTAAKLSSPYDMALSSSNRVAPFTDYGNNAIRALVEDLLPISTSEPTISPTPAPTAGVAEHIFVHAMDIHGDGWGNDLYLAVQHHGGLDDRRLSESEPMYYSLSCACKVIRLFSDSGDMTLWMYRNNSESVSFEWEALIAIGYSDGISSRSFNLYGGVDSKIEIGDWDVISSSNILDFNADAPTNKCVPPPSKPAHITANAHDNSTSTDRGAAKPKPPPLLASVRLTLMDSENIAWCDDSGATHEISCSKENHFSPDATIPNILTYPRYFISDTGGRTLMQQGTMRVNAAEDVRDVKLPREGAYILSVSGHYLSVSGTLSWNFCGEQGSINERIHFNMVNGVCQPLYIETLNSELSCDGDWITRSHFIAPTVEALTASSKLSSVRLGLHVGLWISMVFGVLALVILLASKYIHRKQHEVVKVQFSHLNLTDRP